MRKITLIRKIVDGLLLTIVTLAALWIGAIYIMVADSKECNVLVQGTNTMGRQFMGSGVLVTEDGYVITAGHCARDTSKLKITLYDGTEYEVREYFVPEDANLDFAIIKLPINVKKYRQLADSNTVSGWIYNIGNAKGIWENSFFYGRVYKNHFKRDILGKTEFILARMGIYPGCSGGGVYRYNRLIGIAVIKPDENGALIVPSNVIKANWTKCKVRRVGEI